LLRVQVEVVLALFDLLIESRVQQGGFADAGEMLGAMQSTLQQQVVPPADRAKQQLQERRKRLSRVQARLQEQHEAQRQQQMRLLEEEEVIMRGMRRTASQQHPQQQQQWQEGEGGASNSFLTQVDHEFAQGGGAGLGGKPESLKLDRSDASQSSEGGEGEEGKKDGVAALHTSPKAASPKFVSMLKRRKSLIRIQPTKKTLKPALGRRRSVVMAAPKKKRPAKGEQQQFISWLRVSVSLPLLCVGLCLLLFVCVLAVVFVCCHTAQGKDVGT